MRDITLAVADARRGYESAKEDLKSNPNNEFFRMDIADKFNRYVKLLELEDDGVVMVSDDLTQMARDVDGLNELVIEDTNVKSEAVLL